MRIKFWAHRGDELRQAAARSDMEATRPASRSCAENNLLIIDSGSGIAELGKWIRSCRPPQAHLLITHTHLDLIQGFPFFLPAFVPGTHLTNRWACRVRQVAAGAFADQMDPAYFPVA